MNYCFLIFIIYILLKGFNQGPGEEETSKPNLDIIINIII